MKNLHKHSLNFEKTFPFFRDSLEGANTLSSEVLNSVNFKNGSFFTLLPDDADFERLYEFKEGIILPQNPLIKHENSNCYYQITPNTRDELSALIFKAVASNNDLTPVFDDFFARKPEKNVEQALAFYYEEETYYTMSKDNASAKLIKLCLGASNAFWHSLCILTKLDIQSFESETLFLEDLTEICLKAELILVGAYDGEGYIFWERTPNFFP